MNIIATFPTMSKASENTWIKFHQVENLGFSNLKNMWLI